MSPSSMTGVAVSEAPASRLDTLPPWPWDPLDPSAPLTLGWEAIRWAESILIQPNGPRAKKPFRFTPRQMRFLLWFYAMTPEGQWLFHHGVRRLAKGSGKSPFAAVYGLIEFCGPVRLARKDDRVPGGLVGKQVDMPLVQIAATAESQTANTMRMVRAFAPKGSKVVAEYNLDPGKTRYYKLPEGTLEVITSSVTASEGAEGSSTVADETEHWKPSNSGPELASTLEDNLAKSGSRMLETANAWVPGMETVAEDSWDAWILQEEGRLREDAGRILYDAVMAPAGTDLTDYDSLVAALRWVYEDCDWKRQYDPKTDTYHGEVDVDAIVKRIWSPRAKPSESKRKYLNWPSVAEDAWIDPVQWTVLADATVTMHDDDEVVLFFDGSKSRDATALIGCRVSDGHVFTAGVWEPNPSHDSDETVDVADVDRVVAETCERFDVVGYFADVREWESFALTEWPNRYGEDLCVWAVPQGKPPQPIAWDMRGHTAEFARAAEACHAEITDGSFTHDGDSRVARHIANARRRAYRQMVSIGKESPDSPKKIDAAVCVIGARMVRRLYLGLPEKKKRKKKTGRAAFY